ncbi:MAG: hypothetical protein AAGH15_24250 [Myxococcota bacterium]
MNFAPTPESESSDVHVRAAFEPVIILAQRRVSRGLRDALEARWECWEANDLEGAEACLRAAGDDALLVLDPRIGRGYEAMRLLGVEQLRAAVVVTDEIAPPLLGQAFKARVLVLPRTEEAALLAYVEERVAALEERGLRPLERRRAAERGVAQRLAVSFGWTPAERDVVLGRLRGQAVKRIAAGRGSGAGTVKKQLAIAARKAGMAQQPLLQRIRDEVELWMAGESIAA